jgi:hypothetical protein
MPELQEYNRLFACELAETSGGHKYICVKHIVMYRISGLCDVASRFTLYNSGAMLYAADHMLFTEALNVL